MKLLILAEKSSAASEFAEVLGGRTGYVGSDSYEIAHSHGHLLELKDPVDQVTEDKKQRYGDWDTYKPYPWNLEDFSWQKKFIDSDAKKIVTNIKQAAADKDGIVIATDCDPSGEGDLLAWEIINAIGWKKKVYRAYFSSQQEIKDAILNKKEIIQMHNGEFLEAASRQRFDYSSMQLSRIAKLAMVQAGYAQTPTIRLGRFKSALVMLVYQQIQKIKSYVRKPFYEVRYVDGNNNIFKRKFEDSDSWRFADKSQAQADCRNYLPDTVIVDSTVIKKQEPPKLINLMDLATLLAKQGYSTNDVETTYQKMYEADYVSYPRTEDTKVDLKDFNKLLPLTDEIAAVVGVNSTLLTHRSARKKFLTKKADHGANRPGMKVPTNLDELRKKFGDCGVAIYQQLAKSWLAILCEDYVYEQQKAHLDKHPEFTSTTNIPKDLNYKLVFNEQSLDDDTTSSSNDNKGFTSTAKSMVAEGANPAPAKPTLSFLSKFLDKNNIGTGATRLHTIKEISNSKDRTALLKVKKNQYELTYCGLASALLTQGCEISSPTVTKQLLEYMDLVKTFKMPSNKIPILMTKIVEHDMPLIRQNAQGLGTNLDLKKLYEAIPKGKPRISGVYLPTGKLINFSGEFLGHTYTEQEQQDLLAGKEVRIECTTKKGANIIVPGKLGTQIYKGKEYWGLVFDKERIEVPDDGKHTEGKFVPTGETVRFKNIWASHKFTDQEQQSLLAGNVITFPIKTKVGTEMTITGKLAHQIYVKGKKQIPYWGFLKQDAKITNDPLHTTGIFTPTGKEVRFKNVWANHKFTDQEQKDLLAGKKITLKLKGKKSYWYATGGLREMEYKGKKFWGFDCEKKEWAS